MRRNIARVDAMLGRLQEAATPPEPVLVPVALQPGFNMNRRVHAGRMLRKGDDIGHVAAALGVSKSCVSEIAMYARDAGVDWPLASTLNDDELQARLYPPPRPRSSTRVPRTSVSGSSPKNGVMVLRISLLSAVSRM